MNEQRVRRAFEMQPSWRGIDYAMFKSGYLCAIQQMEEKKCEPIKIVKSNQCSM